MKGILIVLLLTCTTTLSFSQQKGIRLNLYGAYVFDDQVDSYYSNTSYFNGKVIGGFLWGAGLEYRLHEYYGMELLYQRLDTHGPIEYYDLPTTSVKTADLDLGISYIMLAGSRLLHPANGKAEAYGGFMLGMALVDADNPTTGASNSSTEFAWGVRLGGNIWASEKVGFKLQTQLLSIPQGAGGSLYFGTGGAGAGVSTYSSMTQFVLGGGIAFRLGGASQPKTAPAGM